MLTIFCARGKAAHFMNSCSPASSQVSFTIHNRTELLVSAHSLNRSLRLEEPASCVSQKDRTLYDSAVASFLLEHVTLPFNPGWLPPSIVMVEMLNFRNSHDETLEETRQKRSRRCCNVCSGSARNPFPSEYPWKCSERVEVHLQSHHRAV